ncbi:hypothetical protein Hanom_Chr03g00182171 [Helianthus anomalus]
MWYKHFTNESKKKRQQHSIFNVITISLVSKHTLKDKSVRKKKELEDSFSRTSLNNYMFSNSNGHSPWP